MLNNSSIKRLAARAAEAAAQIPCAMSIAIVDEGANLAYLERLDGAMIGSVEAARRKARCAVLFKRPTKAFEEALAGGRMAILSLPEVLPIEGGIPLIQNGQIVGAVGISGGTGQQDGLVATAAVHAFEESL